MDQQTFNVVHESGEGQGRFVIFLSPQAWAEMTYVHRAADVIVIEHTNVPDAYAGQGIAGQLMRAAIAAVQQRHWRVVPVCPYARAQFERHPQWDLLREKC